MIIRMPRKITKSKVIAYIFSSHASFKISTVEATFCKLHDAEW